MKTGLRRHLTPGNAVAVAALVVALGGTAVAQVALSNGSVTTPKIQNSAVKSAKIANGAVTANKIASGAVNADKIAGGAVKTAKIANSAVKTGKIANGAVTAAKVADGSLSASDMAPGVLGGLSASKVTVETGDPVTMEAGKPTPATVSCPAGQLAISGGYNVGVFGATVQANGPTSNGQGWSVTATGGATGPIVVPQQIIVRAVCVAP